MAPSERRAGNVTTHLFVSSPGLSGLIWWQIRLSYLTMVWNNPATPSVPRGDRREKIKTAVGSLPKYIRSVRQVREREIRRTSNTEQCYSPAWCFPPPLQTSRKGTHLSSKQVCHSHNWTGEHFRRHYSRSKKAAQEQKSAADLHCRLCRFPKGLHNFPLPNCRLLCIH